MRINPWMAVDRLGLDAEQGQVRPDQLEDRRPPRSARRPRRVRRRGSPHRARSPPRSGACTDPGPATRSPSLAVIASPPNAQNSPLDRVGRDLGPADRDAAPERRQPAAPQGVHGQAEHRPPQGQPDDEHDDREQRGTPAGATSLRNDPLTSPCSQDTEPPPGESRTSRVVPAQTNDIARVTTMSGTRVTTMSEPLIGADQEPQRQDAEDEERSPNAVALALRAGPPP